LDAVGRAPARPYGCLTRTLRALACHGYRGLPPVWPEDLEGRRDNGRGLNGKRRQDHPGLDTECRFTEGISFAPANLWGPTGGVRGVHSVHAGPRAGPRCVGRIARAGAVRSAGQRVASCWPPRARHRPPRPQIGGYRWGGTGRSRAGDRRRRDGGLRDHGDDPDALLALVAPERIHLDNPAEQLRPTERGPLEATNTRRFCS